jgi:hypothetical protein
MALLHQPRNWQDDRAGVTPRTKEMTALWLLMIVLVALVVVVPLVWVLSSRPADKPADPPAPVAKKDDPPGADPRTAELEAALKKSEAARLDLEKNLHAQIDALEAAKNKPAAATAGDRPPTDLVAQLQTELQKAKAELAAKEDDRKRQEALTKQLSGRVDDLEAALRKPRDGGGPAAPDATLVTQLQIDLARAKADLVGKESERKQLADQVTNLNLRVTQLTTKGGADDTELQGLRQKVSTLTASLADRDASVTQLNGTVTKLNGDVASRDQTIQLLRDQIRNRPPVIIPRGPIPIGPPILVRPAPG